MSQASTRHRRFIVVFFGVLVSLFVGATVAAQADGEGTQGTLQFRSDDPEQRDRVPIEGGEVVVYEAELTPDGRAVVSVGAEVGRGTSGADGTFSVDVPGPGSYAVELQVDSLPEGVELVDETKQVLPLELTNGQRKNVLFNLAEGDSATAARERTSDGILNRGARLFVEGVKFGLIIGMCAVGLSLIFGTTGLVNFAHSEMITIGAVIAWFINVTMGIHLIPAAVIAMCIGGMLGAGLDRGLWRPLRRRGSGLVAQMIISIGLSIFLRYLVLYIFGDRRRPYDDYAVQTKQLFTIGPVSMTPKDFFMIVTSIVVLVGVALLLRKTKLGKAMRAVSDNPDLAASTGIDVNRIITLVWFTAGFLVTLGGVFQGLSEQVQWLMGFQLLLLVFAGLTLGGLGTDFGAMVGSLVIGVFIFLSSLVVAPELKNVGALLVMILVLMVRPQGIFGQRERIG